MDRDLTLEISRYAADFKSAGVKEDEMRSQLKRISKEIKENEKDMDSCDWILTGQIEENIEAAQVAIDAVFSD